MCGIAGIVAPSAARHRARVAAMTAALTHRGPDGDGLHGFDDCLLGHTRLAIVDLETGAQPMLSEDGRVAVTFNGEIYGYRELRNELRDVRFRTSSDTELILALYERHGPRFVERLPGMFAFAIWDDRRRELFAARDRFGEKPFYFAHGRDGAFVFGSELKALLASGLIDPVLSRESISHYLQRLYVPPDRSIYDNVSVIPPGHCLRYSLDDPSVELSRYWRLPAVDETLTLDDAAERFRELFTQAVRRQLIADVPVGAFLSGGLDSSSVVAAARESTPSLHTYSFVFEGDRSEQAYAADVAAMHGTEHVELGVGEFDIAELLVRMQSVYDEPFADSSNIPTYLISREARRHLKVVLTGDGGDELLGGYEHYRTLVRMQTAGRPGPIRGLLARLVGRLVARSRRRFARAIEARTLGVRWARRHDSLLDAQRRELSRFAHGAFDWTADVAPLIGDPHELIDRPSNTVDDSLRVDLQDYMPGDILTKIDRASMAHGLELRAPFLDVDFASFCISLPYRLKVDARTGKRILREAYRDAWPPSIRTREKQGFGAPVRRWLQRPRMIELRREYLGSADRRLFEIIPFERAGAAIDEGGYRTWILLVLSVWLERRRDAAHGPP